MISSTHFDLPPLWSGGPKPGEFYHFPNINQTNKSSDPITRTL